MLNEGPKLSQFFAFKDKMLSLNRSHVMGILNVTPDSFSDGGLFQHRDAALKQAEVMLAQGAAIIDVGGESTRPGAASVSVAEELDRVIPVIEAITNNLDVIVSVDTSCADVMAEAARVGAHMINDVRALQRPLALETAASTGLPVCLMHMQGQPTTMQERPEYDDVLHDVEQFLAERMEACLVAGIDRSKLMLDPGFGFGKTIEHNLRLLNNLDSLGVDGRPLLVGMSRKSMIDHILHRTVDQRLAGSLALAAAAVLKHAFIIRVHDVAETVDVVRMLSAVMREQTEIIS